MELWRLPFASTARRWDDERPLGTDTLLLCLRRVGGDSLRGTLRRARTQVEPQDVTGYRRGDPIVLRTPPMEGLAFAADGAEVDAVPLVTHVRLVVRGDRGAGTMTVESASSTTRRVTPDGRVVLETREAFTDPVALRGTRSAGRCR